jgi:hypothetical protein
MNRAEMVARPGWPAPAQRAVWPADPLRAVRVGYCALVVAAALVQLTAFARVEENLLSTLLATVSSLLGITFALNARRFRAQPTSALVLLFYTTTATSGALLVKSLEWSPLSDRLTVPATTFSVLFATQLVLLAADHLYMRAPPLHALRRFIARRALMPIGLMRWPTDAQFWLLGLMGCASVLLTGTDYESGATFGAASAGIKLVRGFGFLKFAPFLIPFRDALSGTPCRVRVPMLGLALYFVALVGISFATNSRSTFADAVPTIGVCALLAIGLGRVELRRVPKARLVLLALAAVLGSLLLSRVALAMVVVRDYRNSVDVAALVGMTLEAFFNNEWLQAAKARMDTSVYVGDYSETYVDSRFAARFLLTKFHDNILYYFSLFGEDHIRHYKEFMLDRLVATLPDPMLRFFGIALDKSMLVVSNGDYIVYMIDGWGLGGFKTGSMIAEVFAVYGWAFPFVMLGAALMLFVFHDAFAVPAPHGRLAMSPLILLLMWNLVGTTAAFGLGAESVTAIPAGIARGLPQNVLVYVIAIALVRGATRLTGRGG